MGRNRALICAASLIASLALTAQATGADAPPSDWRRLIDARLESYLKDPYSAVKTVTRDPRQGSIKTGMFQHTYGWGVCYTINAKNSYGAYAGVKKFLFVIDEAHKVEIIDGAEDDTFKAGIIEHECGMPADEFEPLPKAPSEQI